MSERAWQLYLDDMIVFCERENNISFKQTPYELHGRL